MRIPEDFRTSANVPHGYLAFAGGPLPSYYRLVYTGIVLFPIFYSSTLYFFSQLLLYSFLALFLFSWNTLSLVLPFPYVGKLSKLSEKSKLGAGGRLHTLVVSYQTLLLHGRQFPKISRRSSFQSLTSLFFHFDLSDTGSKSIQAQNNCRFR